ncbi:hypothetical protein HOA91_02015 [Candidatus Woesearchaeota archaeon]|jgi:hypothetical protein|nr:hypothetical protein [Candidatus Woesearchaeota archaeon]
MLDIEKKCVERFGVNPHYLSYLSNLVFYVDLKDEKYWQDFVDNCKSGWFDTYEKKFEKDPRVLSMSDPLKVGRLNELVDILKSAANGNRREEAIEAYKEISQICGRDLDNLEEKQNYRIINIFS